MVNVFVSNRASFSAEIDVDVHEIRAMASSLLGIPKGDFYLLQNGKILADAAALSGHDIHVVPKMLGGKGGFGSMLRAIGAQIEKTTNREACRDLSGRRLRDINEEKRLKNWIAQKSEREKEFEERRRKKIEKLCQEPKHEFSDENYDKERSRLPERLEDAIAQGLEASTSTQAPQKRKHEPEVTGVKKKKPKLWVDADVEDDLSTSDDDGNTSNEEDNKLGSGPSNEEDINKKSD